MERLRVIQSHLSAADIESDNPYTLVVTLNRPKVLNAQNIKLLSEVQEAVTKAGARTLVLQGAGKSFCAGGDIVHLSQHPKDCPEILRSEFTLPYRVYSRKGYSVAVMKGTTMGAGAGLAYACRARVATPSTVWAFPETGMGVLPDIGANFILPRLNSKALGLYLALTGHRVNGADCYYLGIATHYVDDSRLPELVQALSASGNPVEVLNHFHNPPERSLRTLPNYFSEIEELFGNVNSVEDIMDRLRRSGSIFAKRTLTMLEFMCPLALKAEFHMFRHCDGLTYGEVLDKEYDVNCQLTAVHNANFHIGVGHRLVLKAKTRPLWMPATLSEVTEEMVAKALRNDAGAPLNSASIRV